MFPDALVHNCYKIGTDPEILRGTELNQTNESLFSLILTASSVRDFFLVV